MTKLTSVIPRKNVPTREQYTFFKKNTFLNCCVFLLMKPSILYDLFNTVLWLILNDKSCSNHNSCVLNVYYMYPMVPTVIFYIVELI